MNENKWLSMLPVIKQAFKLYHKIKKQGDTMLKIQSTFHLCCGLLSSYELYSVAQWVKALALGPGDSSPIPVPYENGRAPPSQSCPLTSTRHCGMHAHIHIRCALIIIKSEPLGLRKKSTFPFSRDPKEPNTVQQAHSKGACTQVW